MTDLFLLPRPTEYRETGRRASFIEAAPLVDVLFEQLEYLVTHSERECPQGCPDCDRLQRVKKLLLAPFTPMLREHPDPWRLNPGEPGRSAGLRYRLEGRR